MKRTILVAMAIAAFTCPVATANPPAPARDAPQLGSILKGAQKVRGMIITEGDEIRLGQAVSEKVRARYGVVQDPAVHRYVTLVGASLAISSSRPNVPWTFIVLDTDGVNAFAAPGGLIHITRGALGLLNSEAELAGVLAHEITHVTQKHTVKAIQEGKLVEFGAGATSLGDSKVFTKVVDAATETLMAGFGRKEELESDREGIRLADKVGYEPHGLEVFLKRLSDRNKAATEKQGLFASHPEMRERLDLLARQVTSERLASAATLEDRYHKFVSYKAKPQTEIAAVTAGSAGLAGGAKADKPAAEKQEEQPKKKGFGLGSLLKPTGTEAKSADVTGSGASRGVNTERDAKGGANPAIVVVNVQVADIQAFKKEGNLK